MQKSFKKTRPTESWWGVDKKKYQRNFLSRYFRNNVGRRQEQSQLVDPFVVQVVYF